MSPKYSVLIVSTENNYFQDLPDNLTAYNIVVEENPGAVIKKINKEHFDIILLSNQINGESTFPLFEKIRTTHSIIPVVIAFQSISAGEAVNYANGKVSYFLKLPAGIQEIQRVIEDCIDSGKISQFKNDWQMSNELSIYINNDENSINDFSEAGDQLAKIMYPNQSKFLNKFKSAVYEALESVSKFGCKHGEDKIFAKISFNNDHVQVCVRDPGSGFNYNEEHKKQKVQLKSGKQIDNDYGLEMIEYLADSFVLNTGGDCAINFFMFVNNDTPAKN